MKGFGNKSSLIAAFILSGIILFHVVINGVWLRFEQAPPAWDQAAYAKCSLAYYNNLRDLQADQIIKILLNFLPDRAPLVFIIGALFCILFGFSYDTVTMSNSVYLVLLVIAVYGIGKKVYSRSTGLLAAFIVSTVPMIAGLSREFLVDYALAAFVAMNFFLLLETEYFSKKRASVWLGVFWGLGMLTKITFPVFLLAPLLYMVICSLKGAKGLQDRKRLLLNFMLFAGTAFFIVCFWYIHNFNRWSPYLLSASFGEGIQKYSSHNYCTLKDFIEYFRWFITFEFSSFYFFFGALCLTCVIIQRVIIYLRRAVVHPLDSRRRRQVIVLLLWFVIPYTVIACSRNRDLRINVAAIAPVGIFLSWFVCGIRQRWFRRIMICLLVLTGSAQLIKASFGLELPKAIQLNIRGTSLCIFPGYYAYCAPPDRHHWQIVPIIRFIQQSEAEAGRGGIKERLHIGFIPDLPRFEGNALMYYLELFKVPHKFVKVAYNPDRTYGVDLCQYIITKTGAITLYSPWAVKYSREAMEAIEGSGNFKKLDTTFPLPDGSYAIIYKRIEGAISCP